MLAHSPQTYLHQKVIYNNGLTLHKEITCGMLAHG